MLGTIFGSKVDSRTHTEHIGKESKMNVTNLLENLTFGSENHHAEPLHVDRQGRAILFTLKPDQSIQEHNAPSSPFFVVVLKGQGVFTGSDGVEHTCGPNTLLVFDAGEQHTVRAVDELVFVGFLHGAPGAQK
jgi:quercetin dioxygenase-like cupin family protein